MNSPFTNHYNLIIIILSKESVGHDLVNPADNSTPTSGTGHVQSSSLNPSSTSSGTLGFPGGKIDENEEHSICNNATMSSQQLTGESL